MKTLVAALLAMVAMVSCSESPAPAIDPTVKTPDEQAAVAGLKAVNQAQADFIRRTRRYAQTYNELIADHLLDREPTKASTGYNFLMLPSPDAVSYTLTAAPSVPGARYFFTDLTGVIRGETDKAATAQSPAP